MASKKKKKVRIVGGKHKGAVLSLVLQDKVLELFYPKV